MGVCGSSAAIASTAATAQRLTIDGCINVPPDAHFFQQAVGFASVVPVRVFHLIEPDINQELYGLPEYLSALNSAWLNEAATLFRRKYYQNGAHAGYILYMTDAAQSSSDIEQMRKAMRDTKGLGNFRNLFMYAPNGKPDGIKILPLSEVATKDDFFNIKKASQNDLLCAHRVPPQMMGIIPENSGGFGDSVKASQVFVRNELTPLQERFKELNAWFGEDVIKFTAYELTPE
ncbi:UNVERIFIED_ORG: PBSX family phage portal protein [Rahnella aquatilis]